MALLARLSEPRVGQKRAAARRTLSLSVPALSAGGTEAVLIHNLSEHGLRIETVAALQVDETIQVKLPEAGTVEARVAWVSDGFAGCRFRHPIPTAAVSAALLRSPAKAVPAWRVELPMIDVVERPSPIARADVDDEPAEARAGIVLAAALVVALAVAALLVAALLVMALSAAP